MQLKILQYPLHARISNTRNIHCMLEYTKYPLQNYPTFDLLHYPPTFSLLKKYPIFNLVKFSDLPFFLARHFLQLKRLFYI